MEPNKRTVVVIKQGRVLAVQGPATDAALRAFGGCVSRARASNILPLNRAKRLAFRLLRHLFGETGRASDWTRAWKGPAIADMAPSGGPVLGPFPSRAEALAAEAAWLADHLKDLV